MMDRPTNDAVASAVDQVMDLVERINVPGALNIYSEADCTADGEPPGKATGRAMALRHYLNTHWEAPTILVGEAPGKDGARWSGVPFTSEYQLTGSGRKEPSATRMRTVLSELDCEHEVLLWNACVLFPPNNRDPKPEEIDACSEVLEVVSRGRTVFAVGKHAEKATGAPYICHPANDKFRRFAPGMNIALRSQPSVDVRTALNDLNYPRSARPSKPAPAPPSKKQLPRYCPGCHLMLPKSGQCDTCDT